MLLKKMFFALFCVVTSHSTIAAETNLSYPELDVTPRATERLNMLAEKEQSPSMLAFFPMQISALSTLTTGILRSSNLKDEYLKQDVGPNPGIIVGALWLGVNFYLGQKYKAYTPVLEEVNKVQGKTPRDQLIKERLAEEGINKAASLATKLKWLSVGTNLAANVVVISQVKNKTAAKNFGGLAVITSFAPLLFTSDWENVAVDQQTYKKKVYGPIFTTSLFETSAGKFSPGLLLSATF